MEEEAEKYFEKIESLGGVIPAIEQGFFQREIADAACHYQQELIIVGVNEYVQENQQIEIPILEISKEVETKQPQRIVEVRIQRSKSEVDDTLSTPKEAAESGANPMPCLLQATRSYVTLGEMCDTLKEVFGVYGEPIVF